MKDEDVHLNLLSRYVANEISLAEVEELLQWISEDPDREDLLRDFQETWDIARSYPENFKVDTPSAWVKVRNTISEAEPARKINPSLARKWITIIVVFAMMVIGVILAFKLFYLKR